jgi:shikimate kinase
MVRLIGPGAAGKSTIGALVAERLGVPFVDLDRHLAGRV